MFNLNTECPAVSKTDSFLPFCMLRSHGVDGREGRIYINKIIVSRDDGSNKEQEMAALLYQAVRDLLWKCHLRSKEREGEAMGTMGKEHSRRKKGARAQCLSEGKA